MVSSGSVTSDLGTFNSSATSLRTCIEGLSSSWQGPSYENLLKQVQAAIEEFKAAIEKQMQAFAAAIATYQQYKEVKERLQAAQAAVASLPEDDPNKSSYYGIISECQTKLEELKKSIEASLAAASSPVLSASSTNTTISTEHLNINQGIRRGSRELTNAARVEDYAPNSSQTVKNVLSKAFEIAQDDTHGYSQNTRYGNPNYDCSSFVITCWDSAGTGVKAAGAKTTHNMKKTFTSTGNFIWIEGNPKVEDLQPGDILLNQQVHTELYIGNGNMVGAHGDFDNTNGDGNGREIGVCPFSGKWEGVLRYVGEDNLATQTI